MILQNKEINKDNLEWHLNIVFYCHYLEDILKESLVLDFESQK
jgi:hypothetical protein